MLELKQDDLSFYHGKGVKLQILSDGLIIDDWVSKSNYVSISHPDQGRWVCNYTNIKPILSKLGDFTNEEWLEVFKAGVMGIHSYKKEFLMISKREELFQIIARCEGISVMFYYNNIEFFTAFGDFNQHKAFQMIYKKMGDINDLIGKGLAIDKKTIGNT